MTTEDILFTQAEAAFRALNAALATSQSSSVALFIDPTLIDPLAEYFGSDNSITRCQLTALEGRFEPDRLPYVAHVQNAERSWRLLDRSIEQAVREAHDIADDNQRPRSICGWIVDPGEPYALARSLGNAALAITPEKERWPLRYWDPRVIGHLPRVLAPEQYAALRACLGNWWSINGGFRLAPAARAAPDTAGKLPLRFHAEGWRSLQRIGHINEVMRIASEWGIASGSEPARRIDESMQRAERHGFTADEDLRAFAICALIGHPRFDEHPRVAQSIGKARAAGQSFAAAIGEYDDEFWAGLNDGRWLELLQQGVMT